MYAYVKSLLKEVGELMIKTADGQTFELHLHNAKFDDEHKVIVIDAGAETYWIAGNQLVYAWIHRVKE